MTNKYLAFAEWRITTHRSRNVRKSVRFFRKTRNHTLLWTVMMRGHYRGTPPSVNECIGEATCSRQTTRKILLAAQSEGFLRIVPADDDSRKRLVVPTERCVAEYEAMVNGYLALAESIADREEDAGPDGR